MSISESSYALDKVMKNAKRYDINTSDMPELLKNMERLFNVEVLEDENPTETLASGISKMSKLTYYYIELLSEGITMEEILEMLIIDLDKCIENQKNNTNEQTILTSWDDMQIHDICIRAANKIFQESIKESEEKSLEMAFKNTTLD